MERLNNLYTFERSQHNFRANQLTVRSCLSSSFFIRLPICGLFCDCWCSSSITKTDYVLAASPTSLGCFWFLFCTKKARVLYRLLVSLLKASRIAPIVWRATRRAHAVMYIVAFHVDEPNIEGAYRHTMRTSTRCLVFDNRSEFARLRAVKEQSVDKRLFCICAPTHPLCIFRCWRLCTKASAKLHIYLQIDVF